MEIMGMCHRGLGVPIVCLVTDRASCRGRLLEAVVGQAVAAGVNLVQLRDWSLSARELLDLGSALLDPVRACGAALVVNDRIDVAMALSADGVHLGRGSLTVGQTRRLVGEQMLLGVSVHGEREAKEAEGEGADYLILGTVFETPSHPGRKGGGLGLVTEVAAAVKIPVVAIGGIDAGNAGAVFAAGASGVAVIRAIQSAADVTTATRAVVGSFSSLSRR
jgi:thiamine-phosphate pyrophosphorylase